MTKSIMLSFRASPELVERIEELAKKSKKTRTAWIVNLLNRETRKRIR